MNNQGGGGPSGQQWNPQNSTFAAEQERLKREAIEKQQATLSSRGSKHRPGSGSQRASH